MLIMLPMLTVFGNCVGMVGGWSSAGSRSISPLPPTSCARWNSPTPWDLYSGLIKSVVFAWLIITIACHMGLDGRGRRGGRGPFHHSSVVWSLLIMLIANATLTALFFFAG